MSRKEEFDALIAAFDRVMHEDHLNPEHAKCPGRAALIKLSNEPRNVSNKATLDHLRECSACLDELRKLRASGEKAS